MTTTTPRSALFTEPVRKLDVDKPIKTVQSLASHLHVAGQVELSTIPLYLFTAYSIRTKGYSQWSPPEGALRTLIGVAIEEMLHLVLVRNLMVAIGWGDQIRFYDEKFIPEYPSYMLNRKEPLLLQLRRLSTEHVQTFIDLEKPDKVKPEDLLLGAGKEIDPSLVGQYTSLGAFYRKIEEGFTYLYPKDDIWSGAQIDKQYLRGFWNQFGAGKPIRVNSLKTALQALTIIIDQGEGSTQDHKTVPKRPDDPTLGQEEYSHYWKFVRIKKGIEGIGAGDGGKGYDFGIDSPMATWPVVDNPKVGNYLDNPPVLALMKLFNAAYCYMLCILDELFQKSVRDVRKVTVPGTKRRELHSHRYGLERNGIAAMQGIMYPIAELMVRTPIDPDAKVLANIGPSFEFYKFDKTTFASPKKELEHLCDEAIGYFPELGGDDSVRRQISLLVELDFPH